MGEYTIDLFADIRTFFFFFFFFGDVSTWEACTVTQKLDPDLMFERSIRTIRDKNMKHKSLFVEIANLCASYDPV